MTRADEQLDTPLFASIVVVNYNGGKAVLNCLQSVTANSRPNVEVIVVDNASDDGSAEAIRQTFRDLRVIDAGANIGFGAGNNLGARHAAGEYIAFLNPDTVVTPGWLDALVEELEWGTRPHDPGAPPAQPAGLPNVQSQNRAAHVRAQEERIGGPRTARAPRELVGLVTGKILMADDPAAINTCG